ncbi:hypothetical protein PS1_031428 [Malus domestica]
MRREKGRVFQTFSECEAKRPIPDSTNTFPLRERAIKLLHHCEATVSVPLSLSLSPFSHTLFRSIELLRSFKGLSRRVVGILYSSPFPPYSAPHSC